MWRCYMLVILLRSMLLVVCDELGDFEFEEGPWSVLLFGQYTTTIEKMCPFSDLCSTKLGYEVDRSGSPCCMGCSCKSDCGLTQNCCFPELDLYEIPRLDEDFSSCFFPVTEVYAENLPIHGYTMNDRCPLESACDPCGDQIVAEWGSLYPIYSNETGLIYKNPKCAECYNITDGIIWEPFQIFNLKEGLKILPTGGHLLTSKLRDRKNMVVRFMPPEGVDFDRHACFENIIDSCEPDGAYLMFGNYTDHEMCETGLHAPYFYEGHYYSNVFCAFCYMDFGEWRRVLQTCTPQYAEPSGDLLVSFDKELTLLYGESDKKRACNPDGKKCKDVLCPIGHIRIEGKCVFVHSKRFHNTIQLVLEFNPKTENDRVTAHTLDNVDVSIPLPSTTKWLLKTTIVEQDDSSDILRVYAVMIWNQTRTGHVITDEILESISVLMENSKCSIQYVGAVYTYCVDISRYAYFEEVNHQPLLKATREKTILTRELGSFEIQTEMNTVYTNSDLLKGDGIPVSINKLFFCEQVELQESEFVAYLNGTQIHQNEPGNTYLDGEFLLIEQKNGIQVAKVCLKNSGYRITGSGSSEKTVKKNTIGMSVCAGFLLYLIFGV